MKKPIILFALAFGLGDPTLEETRLTMSKWIETQQIISRERNDWQQGREILQGRLELVRKEASGLDQSIRAAQAQIADTEVKRDELLAERAQLDAVGARLVEAVEAQETEVRRLMPALPEPLQTKLQPLFQRMPADEAAKARVALAERFQNVIGMLNEINRSSTEISVNYEVHTLSDGKPAEVKVIYVGLTQAYYVSASGEAGIGQPSPAGWKWTPSKEIAGDVSKALEIIQGKHSPEFVPLPLKLP